MTLQFHGGELVIDSIRGAATQGEYNKKEKIQKNKIVK
jgi:hypothetical protein